MAIYTRRLDARQRPSPYENRLLSLAKLIDGVASSANDRFSAAHSVWTVREAGHEAVKLNLSYPTHPDPLGINPFERTKIVFVDSAHAYRMAQSDAKAILDGIVTAFTAVRYGAASRLLYNWLAFPPHKQMAAPEVLLEVNLIGGSIECCGLIEAGSNEAYLRGVHMQGFIASLSHRTAKDVGNGLLLMTGALLAQAQLVAATK